MECVPPLTPDRSSLFQLLQTRDTIPVDPLPDCAFLYMSRNNIQSYYLHATRGYAV